MKLRWMINHIPDVYKAHEIDDLLFGTLESWLVYVSLSLLCLRSFDLLRNHICRISLEACNRDYMSVKSAMHLAPFS